jgi:hypothetical protein
MKDFIPSNEALELKKLEFDEPCFGYYDEEDIEQQVYEYANCSNNVTGGKACYHEGFLSVTNSQLDEYGAFGAKDDDGLECYKRWTAPTFSQAFRFFREKYGLYHVSHIVRPYNDPEEEYPEEVWIGKVCQSDREQFVNTDNGLAHNHFHTYEEAELACLKKLIEIVKQKQ